MQRINLMKYGCLTRHPEEDYFSEDGARFQVYRYKDRIRVAKLVDRGQVYISARFNTYELSYDEERELKGYNDLDKLNGVSLSSIEEKDIEDLINTIKMVYKELIAAEENVNKKNKLNEMYYVYLDSPAGVEQIGSGALEHCKKIASEWEASHPDAIYCSIEISPYKCKEYCCWD